MKENVNQKEDEILESARNLYIKLGLSESNWSKWYKKNIVNSCFMENKDYIKVKPVELSNHGNFATDFKINYKIISHIINSAKTTSSDIKITLLKEYNLNNIVDVISKPEIEYGKMLNDFLDPLNIILETQVSVCSNSYRLDFVIDGNIVVEYDEEHHEENIVKDEERTININSWYKNITNGDSELQWIRVKKGQEISSLSEIVKLLVENETLSVWNNKLEVKSFSFNELAN